MTAILVMLNNYFHDFATALVVVSTYGMLLIVRHAERSGGREVKEMALALYPRMVHLAGGSVIFVFFAGIIRSFTFREYEWNDAVRTGLVYAIMIKHVILFILFAYGIYLWVKVYRSIKVFRVESSASSEAL